MGRLFGTDNRAESLRLRTTEVIRAAQRFGRRRLARACGLSGLANELTAGSLQSVDELRRVATYLGADPRVIAKQEEPLTAAFRARSLVIHEMDIDFSQKNRNRFGRTRDSMVRHANEVLKMSAYFLGSVDGTIAASRST